MTWQPLERAEFGTFKPKFLAELRKMPQAMQDAVMIELRTCETFINDTYQVARRVMGPDPAGGELVHLSIRRRDREPCRDWRDFQRIKNQLCGTESEGIELFPAESRLTDTANQYHMWVFTKYKIPVGFKTRLTATPDEAAVWGAKQR